MSHLQVVLPVVDVSYGRGRELVSGRYRGWLNLRTERAARSRAVPRHAATRGNGHRLYAAPCAFADPFKVGK